MGKSIDEEFRPRSNRTGNKRAGHTLSSRLFALPEFEERGFYRNCQATGGITSEMYDKKVVEYKSEQNEILGKMQAHSDADHDFYLTANKVFNLAKRAAEIFNSSEPMEKRQLLSFLLQNCTLSGSKLGFELKEPFNLIVETRHRPIGLPRQEVFRTRMRKLDKQVWTPKQTR